MSLDAAIDRLVATAARPGPRAARAKEAAEQIRIGRGFHWVGLYDVSASEIRAIAWTGEAAPAFPPFPITQGLNGAAVAAGQAVICNDVRNDPRYLTTFGATRAEAIVPVRSRRRIVGTIDVESERVNAFSPEDEHFLVMCAAALEPLWKLEFRRDDLTGEPTRALITRHLAGMYASSPPESVHALDIDRLRQPDVTFWSVWIAEDIVGCGALKRLDARRGEIKSMRVADAFLGRGIGRAILNHLIEQARERGMESLWLETGSTPDFVPALRLYESAGFVRCGPFDGYIEDPFSVFMTRSI